MVFIRNFNFPPITALPNFTLDAPSSVIYNLYAPTRVSSTRGKSLGTRLLVHKEPCLPFSYPEPFLRAVNGARQGALAKSISNWHLIGYNEGYCSNNVYILLPCFYGIRFWIWPEPLVAPRVRRALGTRMPCLLTTFKHWFYQSTLNVQCLNCTC